MPPLAPFLSSPSPPMATAKATGMAMAAEDAAINWIRNVSKEWAMSVLKKKKKKKKKKKNEQGLELGLGLGLGLGCMIVPFGSYALGVPEEEDEEEESSTASKSQNKNVDLLCIGPSLLKPKDLTVLHDILLSKQEEGVSDVFWLPDPLVPRIEFRFCGLIHVNIIYASIALPFLPDDLDICDDRSVLRDAHLPTAMTLDSCRTVCKLLRLVPHVDNFRAALRCLKLWAKRRAVYSNALGFLGDVSWGLLLARVCLDHPDAAPDRLLPLFFHTYRSWRWPDPVMLCPVEEDQDLAFRVWNPQKNSFERLACMPIITPAYPCMNSSRFVSTATRQIMMEQFETASRTCDQIHLGEADWTLLFEPFPFFQAYDYYLQFTTAGVESQLRQLAVHIEREHGGTLMCHPYPQQYAADDAWVFFLGLRWKEDLKHIELELKSLEMTLLEFIEKQGSLPVSVSCVHRDNLPSFVFSDDHADAPALVNKGETGDDKKPLLKRKRIHTDEEEDVKPPAKRASIRIGVQEAFEQINQEVVLAAAKQRKRKRANVSVHEDGELEPTPAKKLAVQFHCLRFEQG